MSTVFTPFNGLDVMPLARIVVIPLASVKDLVRALFG
jgi:hypothetical protein